MDFEEDHCDYGVPSQDMNWNTIINDDERVNLIDDSYAYNNISDDLDKVPIKGLEIGQFVDFVSMDSSQVNLIRNHVQFIKKSTKLDFKTRIIRNARGQEILRITRVDSNLRLREKRPFMHMTVNDVKEIRIIENREVNYYRNLLNIEKKISSMDLISRLRKRNDETVLVITRLS